MHVWNLYEAGIECIHYFGTSYLIEVSLIKKTHNVFIVSVLSLISLTQTYALC